MNIKDYSLGFVLLIFICSACQSVSKSSVMERVIHTGWQYQQVNGKLKGEASVPGTIHTDLYANNQIEDPFYRTNEKSLQWIDKEDWVYSTSFEITSQELKKENLVLSFAGLDTYGDVYFNDSLVLRANNMFRSWEISIKGLAHNGTNNIRIYFHSPIKKGLEKLEASPYIYPAGNDQSELGGIGDKKVSIFTRKAGYHYGWDWGPRFVTSGIWRPVILKGWDQIRINNVFIKQPMVSAQAANLTAHVKVDVSEDFEGKVLLIDKDTGDELAGIDGHFLKGSQLITIPFTIEHPKLWWSSGLGEAHLYHFEVKVVESGSVVASQEIITGIRSLKLVRDKDKVGESFYFELNGVPVFAKGANYIPNDNFLPRVSERDYEKVIADAVDANMNILRVWGGGIYENDYFYELCDKNGLLVWQDFMFACSMYPGDNDFLENVKKEAIDNVLRLRNHPCIALWCGNNEMNAAWHYHSKGGWGWKDRYSNKQRDEIQQNYLRLFHDILPKVVDLYTDGDDYWPSSPQAGYEDQKHAGYDNTSGDMHYWGVWHGLHPFEDFDKYKARFMSEYGFQSFPDFETVKKYTQPQDYDIESEVMMAHQRSGIGNLRIKKYMGWEYKVPQDFQQFLYLSQLLQARGITMAIEAHRRAMPYCMGTMYWQLNDCWPVASWSSTDYYHRWKALHYAVGKSYQSIILSGIEKKGDLMVYGVSDLLKDVSGVLKLTVLNFDGGILWERSEKVCLTQNTSTLLTRGDLQRVIGKSSKNSSVMKMELVVEDTVVAKNLFYFVKPKDLDLPEPHLKKKIITEAGKSFMELTCDKLVKNIFLSFEDQDIIFSDNYFDLLPGEIRKIELTGSRLPNMDHLEIMHLQQVR